MKVYTMTYRAHNPYEESHGVSRLRENLTSGSDGEGLETGQVVPRQSFTRQSAFKALKTSGFNIEDTHLTDLDRVEKLLALVLVAFIWAYKIGVFLNDICPIKIKKHGRRAKSLFKYGLTYLSKVLFSNDIDEFIKCCKFLSCT